jgi:hypothetical protein
MSVDSILNNNVYDMRARNVISYIQSAAAHRAVASESRRPRSSASCARLAFRHTKNWISGIDTSETAIHASSTPKFRPTAARVSARNRKEGREGDLGCACGRGWCARRARRCRTASRSRSGRSSAVRARASARTCCTYQCVRTRISIG